MTVPTSPVHDGHVDLRTPVPTPTPRRAVVALILAVLPMVTWGACVTDTIDAQQEGVIVWLISVALAVTGAVMGLMVRRQPLPAWPGEQASKSKLAAAAAVTGFLSPVLSFVAGMMTLDISRGRRLVRDGQARLVNTTVAANQDWLTPLQASVPISLAAADAWRDNAATEHASVAAFAHLSNQLLALGAPSSLIEDAHHDALDEINHARICFGIAKALDGRPRAPAAFPWATTPSDGPLTLASLAADAVIEACVLEGASARLLALLAKDLRVHDTLRPILLDIARDEARHAQHGWSIVAWACARDPSAHPAVIAALASAPSSVAASFDPRWRDGQLLAWGIPSAALWQQCYDEALAQVRGRLDSPIAVAA
jgi:hypothetical protein